ncbi:MAG: polyprenol monophosphomannose synthase [Actinomycetia bacterium]|nr:polyprenol monophosphomannose synthase [Actinomycetes bacterium]
MSVNDVLVIIPTYNERESLPPIVQRVGAATPDVYILVVDDNSPDGTGELADSVAESDDHVQVLHRTAKNGLGAAYLAGFRWGMARGFGVLVEMDADGSHRPEHLPAMLDALQDADAVIGSRWVPGGGVVNWPRHRRWLSQGGNRYIQAMLGLDVNDATAGYRAYRRGALEKMDLSTVASQGYCFQIDLTRRAAAAGLRIVEVPITFVEREQGDSKMSGMIVAEALWRVTQWGVSSRAGNIRFSGGR